jgi:hypothetical protein
MLRLAKERNEREIDQIGPAPRQFEPSFSGEVELSQFVAGLSQESGGPLAGKDHRAEIIARPDADPLGGG